MSVQNPIFTRISGSTEKGDPTKFNFLAFGYLETTLVYFLNKNENEKKEETGVSIPFDKLCHL